MHYIYIYNVFTESKPQLILAREENTGVTKKYNL